MQSITVIMPSYNVGAYIDECMDSVRRQTLKGIEILAIDAGSTDGTIEKLERHAREDDRIRVHISERKSYGFQVNWGVQHACGEYIAIIETDDIIQEDMLECLYELAQRENADYVKGEHEEFVTLPDGEKWIQKIHCLKGREELYGKVIEPQKYPWLVWQDVHLWNGIYRKDFLLENQICLNETTGAAFQDIGFLFQTVLHARKAVYIEKSIYQYRRSNSDSSIYNPNGFRYLVQEYEFLEPLLKEQRISKPLFSQYYKKLFMQCNVRVRTMAIISDGWSDIDDDVENLRTKLIKGINSRELNPGVLTLEEWQELTMLLVDPYKYFDYHRYINKTKMYILNQLLQEVKGKSDIFIFGCGRLGGFVYCLFSKHGIMGDITFCDNDEKKWNTQYMGKVVTSVEDTVRRAEGKAAVFLIANRKNSLEMQEQLENMGVKKDRILTFGLTVDLLLLQTI